MTRKYSCKNKRGYWGLELPVDSQGKSRAVKSVGMKNMCKESIGTGLDFSPPSPWLGTVWKARCRRHWRPLEGAAYSVVCVWWFVTLLGGGGEEVVSRSRVICRHP